MPTAGRLAGAVAYAVFGWLIAIEMIPFFGEVGAPYFLVELGILLGVLCGWKIVGTRAGRGYFAATGHGLTCGVAWVFWMFFFVSLYQMVRKSLRRLYDGPMEGVADIFELMFELGQLMLDVNLIIAIAAGSVVAAWFAEFFGKRMP